MKRPSFQFYPGDWTGNSNLRRCTHAEKGAWLEVMCLMHDQEDEYGVLRWPLKEVAQAAGCTVATLKSLIAKGVLKGDDKKLEEAFVYVPRSARKDGEPVTLIEPQDGPLWFSSRMVKDEYVRTIRGESSRFGDDEDDAPKDAPKDPPKRAPKPAPKPPIGDGSSSSSSSSTSLKNKTQGPPAAASSSHAPRKPEESPPDWHTDGPQDVAPPPAYGSPGLPAPPTDAPQSREVQLAVLIRHWERHRGKQGRATSTDPKMAEWARKGVTDEQLREAYDLAVADRDNAQDSSPLNAGFIDVFVTKVLHPPAGKPAGKGATRPSERSEAERQRENDEAKRLLRGQPATIPELLDV